ncbi:phospholipase D-like domain-containing protein [Lentisalinibacter sediminis]|uniref:phospholipase D-like domain-containing protein n=1 Tax=Lentisalinibacter sediminis TaxID=2992237 RepID=UPI00386CE85A
MTEGDDRVDESDAGSLFAPGENVWRAARAERFGWLIDGEDYFRAVRESMEAAEREILIVGWDIDSRLELIRDEDHPLYPSPLAETLQDLAGRRDGLQVYVLSWDFAMVYVLERELLPAAQFGWQDQDRLHFQLDGEHATGASQHQKFIVIDGQLAYTGGFDLTKSRWDTRAHAPDDPRRVNEAGGSYRPFHDVQALVTGEPARHLRDLASFRWKNATGDALPALDAPDVDSAEALWPRDVPVRASDAPVALARTWAEKDGSDLVREVEQLFLDMIAAAESSIYIENQYYTSDTVTRALCDRLAESDGPEIVIVLPGETSGWLEQATMDVLRNQALQRLRENDGHGRLRIVSPVSDELGDTCINVHGKVMVLDERWARIGSANLSRRSMGLDSECDLVIEDAEAAAGLRADLLAEHLGADVREVAAGIAEHGLIATLDRLGGGPRRLERLASDGSDIDGMLEPIARIADLERPVEQAWDELIGGMTGSGAHDAGTGGADADEEAEPEPGTARRRYLQVLTHPSVGWGFLAVLILLVGGLAIWQARTAGADFDPMALLATLRESAAHPLAPLAVIPAFIAGSLVVAPVTGMIALCALLFGPWVASVSAIAGTLAATVVNHAIGRRLGRAVEGRAPRAVTVRMKALGRSSDPWSLAGLRLIPIAPFTVINLLAGASRVKLRDFLLGTILGMGPGTVLICFSVDRARAALAGEPVFEPWVLAVIAAAGITLIALRVLQQRRKR